MEMIFSSSYDEKHPPENIFDNTKQHKLLDNRQIINFKIVHINNI